LQWLNCFSGCLLIRLFAALFASLSWGCVLYLSFSTSVVSSRFFDWLLSLSFPTNLWVQWLLSVRYCVLKDKSSFDFDFSNFQGFVSIQVRFHPDSITSWTCSLSFPFDFRADSGSVPFWIWTWTWNFLRSVFYPFVICFICRFNQTVVVYGMFPTRLLPMLRLISLISNIKKIYIYLDIINIFSQKNFLNGKEVYLR
jgi:hypothetical protein